MNIVDRAKNLILQPAAEWDRIDRETHAVQDLYTGWIMILAAIGPVAHFIGHSIVGASAFGISYRMPVVNGLAVVVASYAMSLGLVYLVALVGKYGPRVIAFADSPRPSRSPPSRRPPRGSRASSRSSRRFRSWRSSGSTASTCCGWGFRS